MTYQLYEVWSVDKNGHEELLDTTGSMSEAILLAEDSLTEDIVECVIYEEDASGDLVERRRIRL
jgi:hypothetical protein